MVLKPLSKAIGLATLVICPFTFAQSETSSSSDALDCSDDLTAEQREQLNCAVEDNLIEELLVTGSRIRRSNFDGPTNIEVITRDDMFIQGVGQLNDLLDIMAQATGATQGEQYVNSFTPAASSVNFRGLGGNRTLVLLNGYRMPEYPLPYNGESNFFNTSALPYSAVERTDIVNNGASAIYGSDAVAGVVNIFTRKNFDGTEIKADFATTTEGGGDETAFEFITGKTFDKGWVTFAADYRKTDPIYGKDRDWMDSYLDQPIDEPFPTRALLTYDYFSGLYVDPGEQTCVDFGGDYFYANRPGRGNYCGQDSDGEESIQSEQERGNLYLAGEYDLTNDLTAFGTVMYNTTEISQDNFRLWWGGDVLTENFEWLYLQKIFLPEETGSQSIGFEEDSINIQTGLRGVVDFNNEEYNWEVALVAGNYDSYSHQARLKEEVVNEYYLGTTDLWGYGIMSGGEGNIYERLPSDIGSNMVGKQWQDANSRAAQLTGSLTGSTGIELPGGEVYFATTVEASWNEYDITLDDRTLNDAGEGWANLTGTDGAGERKRYAVAAEFSLPLTDSMEATLATRYDLYDDDSDVGGRFTSQANYRWDMTDWVAFRASYSQSFRAPDMHYLFAGKSGYYTGSSDYLNCSADPSTDYLCQTLSFYGETRGNQDLKEEEGINLGAGFVFTPIEDLRISVDYIQISIDDVVTSESLDDILKAERDCTFSINNRDINSAYCQSIFEKVERVVDLNNNSTVTVVNTSPINVSEQEYRGIDVSVDYDIDTENWGVFAISADYNNVLNQKEREFADDPLIDYRDNMYDARTNGKATFSWQPNEDVIVALTALRTSSILSYNTQERVDPWWTGNLFVQYNYQDNWSFDLTMNNVTNERPPEDATWPTWPYFYRGMYDAYGRKVNLGVKYTF